MTSNEGREFIQSWVWYSCRVQALLYISQGKLDVESTP